MESDCAMQVDIDIGINSVLLYSDQFAVVSAHEKVLEVPRNVNLFVSERQVLISMWYTGLIMVRPLRRQRLLPSLWLILRSISIRISLARTKSDNISAHLFNNSVCTITFVLPLSHKINVIPRFLPLILPQESRTFELDQFASRLFGWDHTAVLGKMRFRGEKNVGGNEILRKCRWDLAKV